MDAGSCLWCDSTAQKYDPHEVIVDIKTNKQVRVLVCSRCWEKHLDADLDGDEVKVKLTQYAKEHYNIEDPDWLCFRS